MKGQGGTPEDPVTRSATSPNENGDAGPPSIDRYAAITLDDEVVVVYDAGPPQAGCCPTLQYRWPRAGDGRVRQCPPAPPPSEVMGDQVPLGALEVLGHGRRVDVQFGGDILGCSLTGHLEVAKVVGGLDDLSLSVGQFV